MQAKPHPEQGFRSCLGIISLVKSYGPERVEAACRRGNDIGCDHLRLDRVDLEERARQGLPARGDVREAPLHHGNIRGADYYH